jgi:hypothetical protein
MCQTTKWLFEKSTMLLFNVWPTPSELFHVLSLLPTGTSNIWLFNSFVLQLSYIKLFHCSRKPTEPNSRLPYSYHNTIIVPCHGSSKAEFITHVFKNHTYNNKTGLYFPVSFILSKMDNLMGKGSNYFAYLVTIHCYFIHKVTNSI